MHLSTLSGGAGVVHPVTRAHSRGASLRRAPVLAALFVMAFMSCALAADLDVRHICATGDVSSVKQAVSPYQWRQGESVTLDLWARRGNAVVDLSAAGLYCVWLSVSQTDRSAAYVCATGTIVSATNGQVRFTLTPAQGNAPVSNYLSHIDAFQPVGGVNTYVGTLDQREAQVLFSPFATNWTYGGPWTPYNVSYIYTNPANALTAASSYTAWTNASAGVSSGLVATANGQGAITYTSAGAGDVTTAQLNAATGATYAAATNWSEGRIAAATGAVYAAIPSTNGFVDKTITNGLAPSSALAEYYLASNPSNYVDRTVTNGLAPSAALSSYYLASNPNGYITSIWRSAASQDGILQWGAGVLGVWMPPSGIAYYGAGTWSAYSAPAGFLYGNAGTIAGWSGDGFLKSAGGSPSSTYNGGGMTNVNAATLDGFSVANYQATLASMQAVDRINTRSQIELAYQVVAGLRKTSAPYAFGWCDAFTDQSGLNAVLSTNYTYSAASYSYTPSTVMGPGRTGLWFTASPDQAQYINLNGANGADGDRTYALWFYWATTNVAGQVYPNKCDFFDSTSPRLVLCTADGNIGPAQRTYSMYDGSWRSWSVNHEAWLNKWCLLIWDFNNGAKQVTLYTNNTSAGAISYGQCGFNGQTYIGSMLSPSYDPRTRGVMNKFWTWHRRLSETERAQWYNGGAGTNVTASSTWADGTPVTNAADFCFSLEEGTGTTAQSITGGVAYTITAAVWTNTTLGGVASYANMTVTSTNRWPCSQPVTSLEYSVVMSGPTNGVIPMLSANNGGAWTDVVFDTYYPWNGSQTQYIAHVVPPVAGTSIVAMIRTTNGVSPFFYGHAAAGNP